MAAYSYPQVMKLFEWYNLDPTGNLQNGESAAHRLQRMVDDLNNGVRTWEQEAASLALFPGAAKNPPAPDPGPDPHAVNSNPHLGGGGGTTGKTPPPTTGNGAIDRLYDTFPWLRQLGIPLSQLQDWAVRGLTGEALYNEVIQTPQYKAIFQAIRRDDGTLRMSEAQYLSQEDQYRTLMKQYGIDNPGTHSDLAAFFSQEIDPNELKQRLDVYDNVKRGAQDIKDAFYVYAGLKPTTDDLYLAAVDPTRQTQLVQQYNQAVATNPPDYATFITRATEAGLNRVAQVASPPPATTQSPSSDLATAMKGIQGYGFGGFGNDSPNPTGIGSIYPDAVNWTQSQVDTVMHGGAPPSQAAVAAAQQATQIDPNAARQVADLLYHGGDPTGQTSKFLNLQELLVAFQFAMIGSAATENGLQLPGMERIQALRDAGVTRAAALSAYSDFSGAQGLLSGEATRAGYQGFGQADFEQAVLLHQGTSAAQLASMEAQEKAFGHATGTPDVTTNPETGRKAQTGLRGQF